MKKLILFLLLPLWAMAQTSTGQEQSFPYGIVNESLQTITTPTYIGTFGTDGTQGKIPSALIAKTSDVADSLATKESVANKSDSYTTSSSTAYVSGKALVEGLGTKQNTLTNPVTGAGVGGQVSFWDGTNTQTGGNRLLWNNTNSYFEVNGNAPRFTLKNNLNNFSTYFTNNANGILILKNHQDKTLAVFSNPVNSTSQPQMAIGNVSSIPVESQLYVYGGMNGANIDARGSVTTDEANIDLEGADWETNPNSIGLSYFGSNATSLGTVLGYAKNKLGIIRFQDTNYAIINSEKVAGVSPIRFGINNIEIGNVNDKGFSYQSDFSSVNSSNPRWLADKGYVDTKAPLSSPTFTGTPTAPTAPAGTNTTQIATTAFVNNTSNLKEDLFNKQNSLAVDGSNTKYPTVTAVNAGLALKSNDNAVVHLTGAETITGKKTFSPTISASGAIAIGTYFTPKLSATANNDILVGLDINPTFTNGSFTGTTSLPVRVTSNQYIGMNVSRNSTGGSAITISNNNGGYNFGVGSINEFFIQRAGGNIVNTIFSTGNSIIQNGGTFTDDLTNRLQVTGTVSSGTTALGNTPPTANNQLTRKDYVDTGLAGKEPSFTKNTAFNKNFGTTAGTVAEGNDSRFTDSRNPLPNSANYIQNQNTAPQTSNMWIDGSIKAKNIQTLDDVSGFYTYGRYSSGQPYSLNILSDAAQGFKFTNSSANPLLTIESSGAALFTSTVTASSFNGSATLTGTPTAPTAAPGTTGNQIATLDYVQATRPYKVYTALLSQSGTSAPTATVLENTIGAIVWSRSVIGGYFATLSGAFTTDKTSVLITNGSANATYIHGAQVSTSNVNVITVADGQIDKATIEIRVYN